MLGLDHDDTQEIKLHLGYSSWHVEASQLCDMLSLLIGVMQPTPLAALDTLSGSAVLDTMLDAQWLSLDTLRKRIEAQGSDSNTTVLALAIIAALIMETHYFYIEAKDVEVGPALGFARMTGIGASKSLGAILDAWQQRWGLRELQEVGYDLLLVFLHPLAFSDASCARVLGRGCPNEHISLAVHFASRLRGMPCVLKGRQQSLAL